MCCLPTAVFHFNNLIGVHCIVHYLVPKEHSDCTALPENGHHYRPKYVAVDEQLFVLLHQSETQSTSTELTVGMLQLLPDV